MVITATILSINVYADSPQYQGKCGDNVNYSYDPSTCELVIKGHGMMYKAAEDQIPWQSYKWPSDKNDIKSVKIEEGVTYIGDSAFSFCKALTSINIPASVTSIGERAFWDCYELTSINIPAGVTSIGKWAFLGCKALTSITIPASVSSIGNEAFWGCKALTSITIPTSVSSIGDNAFWSCKALTSITIPHSVTKIGNEAFSYCNALTSVTYLGKANLKGTVFNCCSKLTEVKVPYDYSGTSFCGKKILRAQNPSSTSESPEIINGICGNNVMYSFNKSTGVLKILGIGEMNNYSLPNEPTPWKVYEKQIKSIEVQSTVRFSANAFHNPSLLKFI